MIIVDIREPDFVRKKFREMGIPFRNKEICIEVDSEEVKLGDFTNDSRSVIIERKRVDDFYNSMVDGRLYEQLRKMDECFSGQKYIILEGYNELKYYQDSMNLFEEFDRENRKLDTKSPIQQVIEMHPNKAEWIWSQVKLCAEFEVAFLQSYDLQETVLLVEQLCEGAGDEPALRKTKKKYKSFSLEENILMLFPQVGKKRSRKILKKFGSLANLITEIRKNKDEELQKYQIFKKMYEVFV